MRALLSTIGSRGDVQPMAALALQLRAAGHDARICAPPDFRAFVEGLDIPFAPLGPEVTSTAKASTPFTPEQIKQMMEGTVTTQFETIPGAAEGCDVIVAGNGIQIAARSVAEMLGIGYVFATYCPVTLPSKHHAPPKVLAWAAADPSVDNCALWAEDAKRWQERWGPALNKHRTAAGLALVDNVRDHIIGENPWLAADAALAPWPGSVDLDVFQTGAWMMKDDRQLSPELEAFLDDGEPPIYFGFGSVRAPVDISRSMIEAARGHGRRVIVSRGWADLSLLDNEADCLSIGEVNQQALFPRVAAIVHHGGAGTTTAAMQAGAPQVVIAQHYDQPYFAGRVSELGVGYAYPPVAPTTETLSSALEAVLKSDVASRARSVAASVRSDGALVAAQQLIAAR